jgi:hypothetical protein
MSLRSKLNRLERLAPSRGECRNPLVLGPPDIFPGERSVVEARCKSDAASPCLIGDGCRDCPDPVRRRWSPLVIIAGKATT